jgi:hypothetical protein
MVRNLSLTIWSVSIDPKKIRIGGHQIYRADGMTFDALLGDDWFMCLMIPA